MNDEEKSLEQPTDNAPDDEPTAEQLSDFLNTDEIDVESALAAIALLHELTREQEPEEIDEVEEADAVDKVLEAEAEDAVESADLTEEEEAAPEAEVYVEYQEVEAETVIQSDFPRPPQSALHRGQMASIVPAALLIAVGAGLTIILTTSDEATLNPALVIAGGIGASGIALISYWLTSARWSAGSFLVGMVLVLCGATAAYLTLANTIDLTRGWPLLLTAVGAAFVITDLVNPSDRRLWLVGLVLAIAGFAGVVVTAGMLDAGIVQILRGLWPVALVIVAVLLIVPIFRRNR